GVGCGGRGGGTRAPPRSTRSAASADSRPREVGGTEHRGPAFRRARERLGPRCRRSHRDGADEHTGARPARAGGIREYGGRVAEATLAWPDRERRRDVV